MKKIFRNRLVMSFVILPLLGYAAKKAGNYLFQEKPMRNKVGKFKDELQHMKNKAYGNLSIKPNEIGAIENLR